MSNVNNDKTINPVVSGSEVERIFYARTPKVKKVIAVKSDIGGASNKQGTVYIPVSDRAYDRIVRLHEALHLDFTSKAFSPKDMLDQGLEDARLHKYCATKLVRSVRRDELTVAIKDLREAIRRNTPNPMTSLVVLRACAMLAGTSKYEALLTRAANILAPDYLTHVYMAIALIKKNNESNWNAARKILAPYFAEDFSGQSKPKPGTDSSESDSESKESEASESEDDNEDSLIEDNRPKMTDTDSTDRETKASGSPKSSASSSASESKPNRSEESKDSSEDFEDSVAGDKDIETEATETSTEETSDKDFKIAQIQTAPKPKKIKLHPDAYRGSAISKYDSDRSHAETLDKKFHKDLIIHREDKATDSVPTLMGNRGKTSSLSGTRINAGRLAANSCNNVRVFNRKRGEGGGAILIDNSGSMSIPEQTLIDFASSLPLATIAYYSASTDSDKTKQGHLTVYAANGKRAYG
jgi:hypothetical protein